MFAGKKFGSGTFAGSAKAGQAPPPKKEEAGGPALWWFYAYLCKKKPAIAWAALPAAPPQYVPDCPQRPQLEDNEPVIAPAPRSKSVDRELDDLECELLMEIMTVMPTRATGFELLPGGKIRFKFPPVPHPRPLLAATRAKLRAERWNLTEKED